MGPLGIGLGEDQRHLGVVAHRDPHLGAVDDPAGVGLARAGALVGGVGAGVRFGQAKAPEPLAGAQLRQVVLLLLLGPPADDRRAHERGLHRHDGPHRRIAASDLLDDQTVGQVVKPGATVLARNDRAEVPLLGHLAHQLEVEVLVAIVLSRRSTISLSVNARAVSRMRRCSSLSSKSMGRDATAAGALGWTRDASGDALCPQRRRPHRVPDRRRRSARPRLCPDWISQFEHLLGGAAVARYFERLASFSRLILFDRRGLGMSDPVLSAPTLEEQMDDVVAVMDAAGSERGGGVRAARGRGDGGAVRRHPSRADERARPVRGHAADVVGARLRLGVAREEREAWDVRPGATGRGSGGFAPRSSQEPRLPRRGTRGSSGSPRARRRPRSSCCMNRRSTSVRSCRRSGCRRSCFTARRTSSSTSGIRDISPSTFRMRGS